MADEHHLPAEALKAMLAYMTRKELVELSRVNRQFYSSINSPPFTVKPLLRVDPLWLYGNDRGDVEGRMKLPAANSRWKYSWIHGINAIESLLELKWLRTESVFIELPRVQAKARPWLELLMKHSHLLRGSSELKMFSYWSQDEMLPEIAELLEKIKPLVGRVEKIGFN